MLADLITVARSAIFPCLLGAYLIALARGSRDRARLRREETLPRRHIAETPTT